MKEIEGFDNYLVTPEGNIYSRSYGKNLKGGKDKDGYILVTLCHSGKNHTRKAHRLVAEAYCPKPEGCNVVHHRDNDKANNHPSNLEWTTISGNTLYAYADGLLDQKGTNNNASKYTEETVALLRAEYDSGSWASMASLAKHYDMPYGAVYSIVKRLRHK